MKTNLKLAILPSLILAAFATTLPSQAQTVVLSEIMADNRQAVVHGGSSPDWIELHNPSAAAVNLSGWSISDDPLLPSRFTLPAGTTLPANGYLVIWCDDNSESEGLHAGFALDAKRGTVTLYRPGATPAKVDEVAYGYQIIDTSIGRNNRTGPWELCTPTPNQPNLATAVGTIANLWVNEWMAAPSAGDDWFELYNRDNAPVALGGIWLTDDPANPAKSQIPALSFLASGGFLRLWANGSTNMVADEVDFRLSASGDTIALYSSNRVSIRAMNFGAQSTDVSQGSLPDGSEQVASFPATPSPAASNYLPLTAVIINELLSHTDPPYEDAVEFHNPGAVPVDISGWFLSDRPTRPRKYQIPAGTVIAPGSFTVVYESAFNSNPSHSNSFSFNSAHGGDVVLSETRQGQLTGYRVSQSFPATENGVSLGRTPTSQGFAFAALSKPTFGVDLPTSVSAFRQGRGATNASPLLGPITFSEIMYHPPPLISTGSTNDNTDDEYIELLNITQVTYPLYDLQHPENTWRIQGGVEFRFPPGTSIPPASRLLVVGFDPQASNTLTESFRARYRIPSHTSIVGPWKGKLLNSGETIELLKPDPPQEPPHSDAGFVPYILVESVSYDDAAPWPTDADGRGASLQRKEPAAYADDPASWSALPPTAGSGQAAVAPTFSAVALNGSQIRFTFTAHANQSYSLQSSSILPSVTWKTVKTFDVTAQTMVLEYQEALAPGTHFYRLVTPVSP